MYLKKKKVKPIILTPVRFELTSPVNHKASFFRKWGGGMEKAVTVSTDITATKPRTSFEDYQVLHFYL